MEKRERRDYRTITSDCENVCMGELERARKNRAGMKNHKTEITREKL